MKIRFPHVPGPRARGVAVGLALALLLGAAVFTALILPIERF